MVALIVCCPLSSIASVMNDESDEIILNVSTNDVVQALIPETNPWVDSSIYNRINSGDTEVRITVITWSIKNLNDWQQKNNIFEKQEPASDGEQLVFNEPKDGQINHRTFWINSNLFHKLFSIKGIIALIDAGRNPEPYDINPFEKPIEFSPDSVRSGLIHGANDAWDRGYTGEGMVVAVADTGVDFGHPDLNGTQARVEYADSNYSGWPLMFDHNSMYYWLVDGNSYPQTNTWYANTSLIDFDNNSDGLLDVTGYNITGINASLSGIYHLGEHPDPTLRNKVGGDVPILVVDDMTLGLYETVYPDIDRDGWFGNETPMRPGEETSGRDIDGDGLWDISAGLVYWVADGHNGAPYAETYAARHGYSNRIPGSGNLTLFMLESGNHGTLCASAIAAQGIVSDGAIKGMAPNATISSIGNHYSGGHALDGWRFIAEGYDGDPATPDQPNIGSFSFGYSSVDDSGSDGYSLYLDWLTRIYNQNTSYAVAIGNGGHGFGTTKVPGAAHGIFSVGAFSSRSSDSYGQNAPWSNRGPNVVGRMDPDIVSVGWSATGDMPLNSYDNANSAWTTWGGTSLATPIAAGLLALVSEAWIENNQNYPKSQELRDFVLSTSDDRGYEPFIQGGGWFNASRAVSTLDGQNGSWWASPAQWNSGIFQGQHRDANINLLKRGEYQNVEINFTNSGQSEILLKYTPTKFAPLEHNVMVWNSMGNGSGEGANDTWNGHQSSEPDLLIPLHLTNNSTIQLHENTTQLRARATIDYAAFDPDKERTTHERVFLQIYRWTDYDSDGIFHNDSDNDGMVDSGEWTEPTEMEEVTYWWSNGPQAEVRVGLPFEDARDGLMLGVWRHVDEFSDEDPVRIEIDWTAFGKVEDDWINIQNESLISGGKSESINMNISVPETTTPGLYQHGLFIETLSKDSTGNFTISEYNWSFPIVTNVPWEGPFSLLANELDGNVSNQTLYSESWISGATRWNWRAESGDWRFLTIDWPSELDTGGMAILDVNWDDNPYTDIDVLWLSEMQHGYHQESTDAYGDSTFFIESRSTNNHVGGGQHNWGTFTGTSQEVFAVPVSEGVHQMVLHTALHGVETNDNPLNISVGYIVPNNSGLKKTVTDWSQGSGNDSLFLLSTIPLPVDSVEAYGWNNEINFDNETAYHDGSNKMDASWWHNFSISNASEISINMNAYGDSDLDLYLFRDSNNDGNFSSNEEVARSWSSSSSESISIVDPEEGNYSIAVLGWSVPGDSVQFWLKGEIIGGNQLRILNNSLLSDEFIAQLWPEGAEELGGQIPNSVLQVDVDFDIPDGKGNWTGFIDILLEGEINFRLPYSFELIDSPPIISFLTPTNMTYTNELIDIQLHAIDIGDGFYLENLECHNLSNNSGLLHASTAYGLSSNGSIFNFTDSWNNQNYSNFSSIPFREAWINSTIPEIEQWHDYEAILSDNYGNTDNAFLSVSYDITSPDLFITGIPSITNQQNLIIDIYTEPNSILSIDGENISIDQNGTAQYILNLNNSQSGQYLVQDEYISFYYLDEQNTFSIKSSDFSGNYKERSFQVVFDDYSPEFEIMQIIDQAGFDYDLSNLLGPTNITNAQIWINIPSDSKEWCLRLIGINSNENFEKCDENIIYPQIFNESTGFPINGVSEYEEYFSTILQINLESLVNGDYEMIFEVFDWANNSRAEIWEISFDTIMPVISWYSSPSEDFSLNSHIQNLTWTTSENVTINYTIDGNLILYENTSYGGYFNYELNNTGVYTICFEAIDQTLWHENYNSFKDCKLMFLDPTIYDTQVSTFTNDGLVSSDSLQVILQRESTQEIRWYRIGSEEVNIIPEGDEVIVLNIELQEGDNQFIIEILSLDEIDNYSISLVKDSIAPTFYFSEYNFRNSPLNTMKTIEGICEADLPVSISSDLENHDFICPKEGNFSIDVSIPHQSGTYEIIGYTIDDAENRADYSINVEKQDWGEWALEDIKQQGPIFFWSVSVFLFLLLIVVTNFIFINRKNSVN